MNFYHDGIMDLPRNTTDILLMVPIADNLSDFIANFQNYVWLSFPPLRGVNCGMKVTIVKIYPYIAPLFFPYTSDINFFSP